MISIHNSIVESAINENKAVIDDFIIRSGKRIEELIDSRRYSDKELDYLNAIKVHLKEIVLADAEKLKEWIAFFNKIIDEEVMESDDKKDFRDQILDKLDYTKMRDVILPKHYSKIGIKACVYCNSNLTITLEEKGGKIRARLQADHYYPKVRYPFLSISFYNLYPVCAPCNTIKQEKRIDFKLYTNFRVKTERSDYTFEYVRTSIANYLIHADVSYLEINFKEPAVYAPLSTFKEVFDIEGIYNTQKDLLQELIIKARIYNRPYKNFLIDSFPKLFNDINLSNRVLIGNYCEPENIHKRPMAKFTQDIAKQLKLI